MGLREPSTPAVAVLRRTGDAVSRLSVHDGEAARTGLAPSCPFCDTAQAPEALGGDRYVCPCCSRDFSAATTTPPR